MLGKYSHHKSFELQITSFEFQIPNLMSSLLNLKLEDENSENECARVASTRRAEEELGKGHERFIKLGDTPS